MNFIRRNKADEVQYIATTQIIDDDAAAFSQPNVRAVAEAKMLDSARGNNRAPAESVQRQIVRPVDTLANHRVNAVRTNEHVALDLLSGFELNSNSIVPVLVVDDATVQVNGFRVDPTLDDIEEVCAMELIKWRPILYFRSMPKVV